MRPYLFILCLTFIAENIFSQGITKNGESTNSSTEFVNKNGKVSSEAKLSKNGHILGVINIITTNVTSLTFSTASGGGNIIIDGGEAITERGVCWSTSTNPTIANSKTVDGTGTGIFESSITGLTAGIVYYIRAYAINSKETAYGSEVSITASIGMSYQGGVVAYILQSTDAGYIAGQIHGLIAAPSDQGSGIAWGCTAQLITGADGIAIGTGKQNTLDIIAECPSIGIAARLCDELELGGYDDWYLPSHNELLILYVNRYVIGGFSSTSGVNYWSSRQYSNYIAWGRIFSNGSQSSLNKGTASRVRAIRSF